MDVIGVKGQDIGLTDLGCRIYDLLASLVNKIDREKSIISYDDKSVSVDLVSLGGKCCTLNFIFPKITSYAKLYNFYLNCSGQIIYDQAILAEEELDFYDYVYNILSNDIVEIRTIINSKIYSSKFIYGSERHVYRAINKIAMPWCRKIRKTLNYAPWIEIK